MRHIIDTHTFIWYATADKRLSNKAREIIKSKSGIYVSVASIWEMAVKVSIGKLAFKETFEKFVNRQIRVNNYTILQINRPHLFRLSSLELHHRDPFDRLIICQSLVEKIPIVSKDEIFDLYEGLEVIW